MSKVIVMGMIFDEGSVPDFGSIYAVKLGFNGVNDYGLNEEDVSKLNSINNAAPGSTALCDDTGNLYRLTKSGWVKFGGSDESVAGNEQAQTLNLSPLNINRDDLTGIENTGQDIPLENNFDNLTVEPINSEELR